MNEAEFTINIVTALATSIAAFAAWFAANQSKKNTELTQNYNEKNDVQKRNEVKPLLAIVSHGTEGRGYRIVFKNLGFKTVLFLEAKITSQPLRDVEHFSDIQDCEITYQEGDLIKITLNHEGHIGTLQVESYMSLKYKTIYNDIVTDTYTIKRNEYGRPERISVDFGPLEITK